MKSCRRSAAGHGRGLSRPRSQARARRSRSKCSRNRSRPTRRGCTASSKRRGRSRRSRIPTSWRFSISAPSTPPFIVTELSSGDTARARIDRGPLTPRHNGQISRCNWWPASPPRTRADRHRDLKPQNLFVTRDGVVKILSISGWRKRASPASDDGSVRSRRPRSRRDDQRGIILGTVGYMAPEQVRGETVDPRADHLRRRRHPLRDGDRRARVQGRLSCRHDERRAARATALI